MDNANYRLMTRLDCGSGKLMNTRYRQSIKGWVELMICKQF